MRQSDEVFSSILTKVGNGTVLTGQESELLESRFRSRSWCELNLRGVMRLFHQNYLVDQFNKSAIDGGITWRSYDVITGCRSEDELRTARQKLHRISTVESWGLL